MKYCPACKKTKEFSEFYKRKKFRWVSEKYHGYCKECSLKRLKKWYKKSGRDYAIKWAKEWREKNPDEVKRRHKKWNWDSKIKALTAYGAKCVCCGIDEPKFLAIDHIGGGGNEHRKTIGTQTIYVWLRKNSYPSGFQVLCHNCNMAKAFWEICPHKS